jgi:hypothetical protein
MDFRELVHSSIYEDVHAGGFAIQCMHAHKPRER